MNKEVIIDIENPKDNDLISRQAVLDCLTATGLKKYDFILSARNKIKSLPPVNPQESIGHWIVHEHAEEFYGRVVDNYECNNCGDWYLNKTNFCPNCGCNMSESLTGSKDVIWYSKKNYSEIVVEPQEESEE
jgi:hypothetical protein